MAGHVTTSMPSQLRLLISSLNHPLLLRLRVLRISRIARIHIRFDTCPVSRELLHQRLVALQRSVHLLSADIVQERALADRVRDRSSEEAVPRLEDRFRGFGQDLFVEERVVHGEAGAGEEVQETAMFSVGDQTAGVGERGRVGHVDGDGVAVTEGRLRDELMQWGPAISSFSKWKHERMNWMLKVILSIGERRLTYGHMQ